MNMYILINLVSKIIDAVMFEETRKLSKICSFVNYIMHSVEIRW